MFDKSVVIAPTLFYTDDGVFLYADPFEKWSMGEILSRITTKNMTQIYRLPIITIDSNTPYAVRILEVNRLTESIEKHGLDYPINASRIL